MSNRTWRKTIVSMVLGLGLSALPPDARAQSWEQTEADEYTRYELLEPDSQSFRIVYDVTATAAGAGHYFNGLRAGSEHTIHSVVDLHSGQPLEWQLVKGKAGRTLGATNLSPEGDYLQVTLARPVPEGGEARIRIDKTYRDPRSYFREGKQIVFSRSLGIKRNSVVLPAGFELIGCNYPSQVDREADGRIRVSFINPGSADLPFEVRARKLPEQKGTEDTAEAPKETEDTATQTGKEDIATATRPLGARVDYRFGERASQDREIVYFLQPPETHTFRLYHDYTETREGVDRYLNVVRPGSTVSKPSARLLDTGEALAVETLRGQEITQRGLDVSDVQPDSEVVVIRFEPVKKGQSVRLRIEETYTDPGRYLKLGDEFIWDRTFGRSHNIVVLPDGWYLTSSAVPARVEEVDGKIHLHFVNDRPGGLEVFIKGRRLPR